MYERSRLLLLPCSFALILLSVAGCCTLAVPIASSALKPVFPSTTPASVGLAYRSLELRGAGGTRLPAWLVGPAEASPGRGIVVLLAENGSNRANPRMLWLAGEVSRMGYEALLVDLRGHGQSGGINTYGLGETRDLLAILRVLRHEEPDRPIAAIGFSLGGACILRAMSMTDAISAAVVFASYARLDRELIRHELVYQTAGGRLEGVARLLWPGLLLASTRLWAGCPRLPEPVELCTPNPVLLFHCTGDPEIPFAHAEAIQRSARAPRLELHRVDRAAHIPALSDGEVWDGFLRSVAGLLGT